MQNRQASPATPRFQNLHRSRTLPHPPGRPLSFPTRADYIDRLVQEQRIGGADELQDHPDLVLAIHEHWHSTAQQGCRFASFLSNNPLGHGWGRIVVPGAGAADWSHEAWDEIGALVQGAITNPESQALSILFPSVISSEGLADLILNLQHRLGWIARECAVTDDDEYGPLVGLELRMPLNSDTESWPLLLGPFEFMPITRCSPITEVALVVKPKTFPLRSLRINPDPAAAHLADMPITLDDDAFDALWVSTERQKALILDGQPEPRAKAKMTLVIPTAAWEARLLIADEPDAA